MIICNQSGLFLQWNLRFSVANKTVMQCNTSVVSRGDSSWVGTASKTKAWSWSWCSLVAARELRLPRTRRETRKVGLIMVVSSLISPH